MPEEIRTNREEVWEDTQDYRNDLIIFHPEEYDEDLEEEIIRRLELFNDQRIPNQRNR